MDVFYAFTPRKGARDGVYGILHAGACVTTELSHRVCQRAGSRRVASIRYPLPAFLAMTVAAILANHVSVLAISEWAARQDSTLLDTLGFPTGQTPCQSTLQRLVAHLDGTALSRPLSAVVTPEIVPDAQLRQSIAIDGKAQRGRLRWVGGGCPVQALSAFWHDTGIVLAQEPILAPTGMDRGRRN